MEFTAFVILLLTVFGFCKPEVDILYKSCKNRRIISPPLKKVPSRSKIQCAGACMRDELCTSANYEKYSQTCTFFDTDFAGHGCDDFAEAEETSMMSMVKLPANKVSKPPLIIDDPCKNNQTFDGVKCDCAPYFYGFYCENIRRDCKYERRSKWVNIKPDDGGASIQVFCSRGDLYLFAAPPQGLDLPGLSKNWSDYKHGFGSVFSSGGGYWLGNENIHKITNGMYSYNLYYSTRIKYWHKYYVYNGLYQAIRVDDEATNYTISYTDYRSGIYLRWPYSSLDMDKSLISLSQFRTLDYNSNACGELSQTGFWLDDGCTSAQVMLGRFHSSGREVDMRDRFLAVLRRVG